MKYGKPVSKDRKRRRQSERDPKIRHVVKGRKQWSYKQFEQYEELRG